MIKYFNTTLLFIFSQFFISPSHAARTESLTTTSYSSGFCQGDSLGQICLRQLQDQAESNAKRDLDFQCRIKQGTLSFFGQCSTYCYPTFLQPDQANYVSCNTRCTYNCEIR